MIADKEEITGLAVKYQVRCLNVYRKLFFDMQERDVSPEIRDRSAELVRNVKAEDYNAAYVQTDAIDYLFNMLYRTGYIMDGQYKEIAVQGKVLIEELKQILNAASESEKPCECEETESKEG